MDQARPGMHLSTNQKVKVNLVRVIRFISVSQGAYYKLPRMYAADWKVSMFQMSHFY